MVQIRQKYTVTQQLFLSENMEVSWVFLEISSCLYIN
jgi:hypothetical protein